MNQVELYLVGMILNLVEINLVEIYLVELDLNMEGHRVRQLPLAPWGPLLGQGKWSLTLGTRNIYNHLQSPRGRVYQCG